MIRNGRPFFRRVAAWLAVLALGLVLALGAAPALADDKAKEDAPSALEKMVSPSKWGGHFRVRGQYSRMPSGTILQPRGTGDYFDAFGEVRLKLKWELGDWGYLETHYEASAAGGDIRRRIQELTGGGPGLSAANQVRSGPISDEHRVMDLTRVLYSPRDWYLSHRLDRLLLAWLPDWGTVRVGRQALTWGNGLLFNPMDLFNPFSPTDFSRDYKIGDDMAWAQVSVGDTGSLQLLGVPRRDDQHDIAWDSSSVAMNYTWQPGNTQYTVIGAVHYLDKVVGAGLVGYLGQACWRLNATYTEQDEGGGYVSGVVNMDYSWTWWGRNVYGWVEFYYNGLGSSGDYGQEFDDPAVADRVARGELFALGRYYWDGQIKIELHPLFTVYAVALVNLEDPSGMVQPRAEWSTSQNTELIFGASLYWGGSETEYGGYTLPGSDLETTAPNQLYVWFTWYY